MVHQEKIKNRLKSYETNNLIAAIKMIDPKIPGMTIVRAFAIQEIESRKGRDFADSLMDELGM